MREHWRRLEHRPKRRPPWWPADEPWPPTRPPWVMGHQRRGRFFFRLAVAAAVFFGFTVAGISLLVWLVATAQGLGPASRSVVLPVLALSMLAFVGLIFAGRALRRLTSPIGDVMVAAGQLAQGNYAVRVSETGGPEVRSLARAFNQMAIRLQTHEDQRRNLLADIAHELRTPLAVIQGNLEGLLDGIYPRDDAHLTTIFDETRIASALIEDLRTLALAETGTLTLHREPTDLGLLIAETADALQSQVSTAGITLSTECAPDIPLLNVDHGRIRQVLTNLLVNALQHTSSGGRITIAASTKRDGSGQPTTVVTVSDTGSGISPEDLPRIFDRFHKSKDSRGSGLGLAIAKNLIVAHGGEITARSEVGKGTTIEIALPVDQLD